MASSLAESALARRFFIGPLVALALVGPTAAPRSHVRSTGTPTPTSSAAPSLGGDLAAVADALTKAHDAEAVFYVDHLVYAAGAGDELKALRTIEPHVRWGVQVLVQVPAQEAIQSEVVILRAPIPGGGSLCMSEVSEVQVANTWYARVGGTAHCPPRRPHMPGWSTDRNKGWPI